MSDSTTLEAARRAFAARFGALDESRTWWVPGRVELLGKHVDYGGGRSLVLAVNRGIHLIARPRRDNQVHLTDARSRLGYSGLLSADLEPTPGRWTNYPVSVLRRVARDFPGADTGMDVVLASSLPSAAGMSSSSAMVIAVFLPLAAFNHLGSRDEWHHNFPEPTDLGGYLGAVENGMAFGEFPADFGVGTLGGSQDHTAILNCREGMVSQFRFLPVRAEGTVKLPTDWCLVIAGSGVHAAKAGKAKRRYNRLATEMQEIIRCWNDAHNTTQQSLLDILATDGALQELEQMLGANADRDRLVARLHQFHAETMAIIPRVRTALSESDANAIGAAVARSQRLAEEVLGNQVEETIHLAASATRLGAIAASAFGAGFGGSVWALVRKSESERFREAWLADYRERYPEHARVAFAFVSGAAEGAGKV